MTGGQLLVSCVLAFLCPGLGHIFQAKYVPQRADVAFLALACAVLPCYVGIGFITIWFMWVISFVECCIWAIGAQPTTAPTRPLGVALALLALSAFGSLAHAGGDKLAPTGQSIAQAAPTPNLAQVDSEESFNPDAQPPTVILPAPAANPGRAIKGAGRSNYVQSCPQGGCKVEYYTPQYNYPQYTRTRTFQRRGLFNWSRTYSRSRCGSGGCR